MSFWNDLADGMHAWLVGGGMQEVAVVAAGALTVYLVALVLVRLGKKRFLGRNTVFDAILGFMLGSTLARAINGDATLVPTVVAGVVLIGMHAGLGMVASRSSRFGFFVKGRGEEVVKDGRLMRDAMRYHHISEHDIEEAARVAGLESIDEIAVATFERSGKISVLRKRPIIVDVDVEEGVKTIRVAFY